MADLVLTDAEKEELQQACALVVGLCDRLEQRARAVGDPYVPRAARRHRDETIGFFERVLSETVAEQSEADVELLLLGAPTAEDMGHKPYRYPFQHQER